MTQKDPDKLKHRVGSQRWEDQMARITGLDASENETTDIDPYAPILTGGAKVDTHVNGKVEGDLE